MYITSSFLHFVFYYTKIKTLAYNNNVISTHVHVHLHVHVHVHGSLKLFYITCNNVTAIMISVSCYRALPL